MSAPLEDPEIVRLERVLPAAREAVFAAWTRPDEMASWFSPTGSADVVAEPMVGGRLRVVMSDGDVRIEHDGEFLEVEPPERLAFTWRSPYTGDRPTVVTIELFDHERGTRLVLTHRGLPPQERGSHAGGWGAILDRLGAIVTATEVDRVFVDVRTEIEIDRPRSEVARYMCDPTNATEWYRNIRSVGWETPPPVTEGSRMRFRARFLGRDLAYTYEVRELVPGERLVMGTADGPFAMETTYTFEDTPGGGTRVGLRNRGEPSGFARMLASVMTAAMRRENTKDLATLKELLERRSP